MSRLFPVTLALQKVSFSKESPPPPPTGHSLGTNQATTSPTLTNARAGAFVGAPRDMHPLMHIPIRLQPLRSSLIVLGMRNLAPVKRGSWEMCVVLLLGGASGIPMPQCPPTPHPHHPPASHSFVFICLHMSGGAHSCCCCCCFEKMRRLHPPPATSFSSVSATGGSSATTADVIPTAVQQGRRPDDEKGMLCDTCWTHHDTCSGRAIQALSVAGFWRLCVKASISRRTMGANVSFGYCCVRSAQFVHTARHALHDCTGSAFCRCWCQVLPRGRSGVGALGGLPETSWCGRRQHL